MEEKTILVVEDSPELAETIGDALRLHGYRPLLALTGKEAVALATQKHPDLILLDIRLPDMSGYEVFFTIREDAWGEHAHFLVLSSSDPIDIIQKNINIPPEHIFFKPRTSIADLLSVIERILTEVAPTEA